MRKDEVSQVKPPWIRVRIGQNGLLEETRRRVRVNRLHTVCEAAFCPNLGRCWAHGRATVMILGDRCTRRCRFCNVCKRPALAPDPDEPRRVARAIRETGLKSVVITSVTRDDLADGGSSIWAETLRAIHRAVPDILIEALIPDFLGKREDIQRVLDARPDLFSHNLETVPRLYPLIRPQALYERSLEVLRQGTRAGLITKTSLMLGLGETPDEIKAVLNDARGCGCQILYMGQYLQPSPEHFPVAEYLSPDLFAKMREYAYSIGFGFVASGPMVRSSYYEEGQMELISAIRNKS